MLEKRLREALAKHAESLQEGNFLGLEQLHQADFQQIMNCCIADIYQRLPKNTQSRSVLPNALSYKKRAEEEG